MNHVDWCDRIHYRECGSKREKKTTKIIFYIPPLQRWSGFREGVKLVTNYYFIQFSERQPLFKSIFRRFIKILIQLLNHQPTALLLDPVNQLKVFGRTLPVHGPESSCYLSLPTAAILIPGLWPGPFCVWRAETPSRGECSPCFECQRPFKWIWASWNPKSLGGNDLAIKKNLHLFSSYSASVYSSATDPFLRSARKLGSERSLPSQTQ